MTPDPCAKCGVVCVSSAVKITRTVKGLKVTVVLCPRCYEATRPTKAKTCPE